LNETGIYCFFNFTVTFRTKHVRTGNSSQASNTISNRCRTRIILNSFRASCRCNGDKKNHVLFLYNRFHSVRDFRVYLQLLYLRRYRKRVFFIFAGDYVIDPLPHKARTTENIFKNFPAFFKPEPRSLRIFIDIGNYEHKIEYLIYQRIVYYLQR